MKKKMMCLLLVLVWILTLVGCGKEVVICDGCGNEIQVQSSANITNEWIVYCRSCELELFGEDGVIAGD